MGARAGDGEDHARVYSTVRLEDLDEEGGVQLLERLRVYVPMEDALRAAFEDEVADEVSIDGKVYVVAKSQSWRRSHTRAILERSAVTRS